MTEREADGTEAANGRCPRRSKAINGYFGTDGDNVYPTFDSVGNSLRRWLIAVHNGGTDSARAFLGTVCLKP